MKKIGNNGIDEILFNKGKFKLLKKSEKAYLAGIVDGEGSLGLYKVKARRNKIGFSFIHCLTISNTDIKLIDWLRKKLFFNNYTFHMEKKSRKNRKRIYDIKICHRKDLKKILEELLPFLIIKKEKAKLLIKYISTRRYGSRNYTKKEIEIYKKFKGLCG